MKFKIPVVMLQIEKGQNCEKQNAINNLSSFNNPAVLPKRISTPPAISWVTHGVNEAPDLLTAFQWLFSAVGNQNSLLDFKKDGRSQEGEQGVAWYYRDSVRLK